ncbi:N-terminal nucleophile aminohydrolase [Auriscalpium vulgare]|uniref:N-terminal nucleophile aminohydrolase n=1 Tax=Auriscalpium vulgare TaxID=40419 RepID=A0ACB8S6R9_9AGAM|nr:N-terminal nucleophile aminohydrolase [Auriscalpium vulgare]
MAPAPFYLYAVHGGAGDHGLSTERAVKDALRAALVSLPPAPSTALDTTAALIASLESSEPLNAGFGSNLTFTGRVECDASLMDARSSAFGAVGALPGVTHPVQVARSVLEGRVKGRDSLGRVPPMVLVGEGARDFAQQRGLRVEDGERLISERARREWEHWRRRLDRVEPLPGEELGTDINALQDTVGGVVMDSAGDLAAGVSSGGLLLKADGRAAVFGAGCYAQQISSSTSHRASASAIVGVAISISGEGELIIQSSLAKSIADALHSSPTGDAHEVLHDVLVEHFYNHWRLQGEPQPAAGVLLLVKEPGDGAARLWCAFTTPSMAIAYCSSVHPKPKVTILRNPSHSYEDDARPPIFITALPL